MILSVGMQAGAIAAGPVVRNDTVPADTLAPAAQLDSADVARWEGSYLVAQDHLITLTRMEFGLVFMDFSTGETRALTPESRNRMSAARTIFGRVPVDFRLELRTDRDDRVTGLLVRLASGRTDVARRLQFRHEEVTFRNGEVTLSATLVLPNGPGPYPAIVRTHGSGAAGRATPAAEWFAYNGIAFLGYDKRGVGRSTGQWRGASIDDLARDALAGVALLKSRPDIDPRRIGISGGSEGAWVAPLAAALSPDIGYLYVGAFSGHDLGQSIVWRVRTLLTADGRFSASQIDTATALRCAYNDAILNDRGWDSLRVAIERSKGAEWFSFARVPASLSLFADPRVRAHERHALAFDPDTAWSRVHVPVLLLAGGHDRSVASIETWPRIEAALKRAANTRYTLREFPTANHEGLDSVTGSDDEFPTLHRYARGYHQALLDWLRSTLLLGPPVSQPATRWRRR